MSEKATKNESRKSGEPSATYEKREKRLSVSETQRLKYLSKVGPGRPKKDESRAPYYRPQQVGIYPEILELIRAHCKSAGNISLTEYVNKVLAQALGISFTRKRGARPYRARDSEPDTHETSKKIRNDLAS